MSGKDPTHCPHCHQPIDELPLERLMAGVRSTTRQRAQVTAPLVLRPARGLPLHWQGEGYDE